MNKLLLSLLLINTALGIVACSKNEKNGEELYVVGRGGSYHLADKTGKAILSDYKIVDTKRDCYTEPRPVRLESAKWGYASTRGLQIPAVYDEASCFIDGVARVEKNGTVFYIDHRSAIEVDPSKWNKKFKQIGLLSDDLIPFLERRENPSSGNAIVTFNRYSDYAGYVNRIGEVVIDPDYVQFSNFQEGLAYVVRLGNNKFEYINSTGMRILPAIFVTAGGFSEGVANVSTERYSGKIGYITKDGNFTIQPSFDAGAPFSEGLAAVKEGGKWGYIGKDGLYKIAPRYRTAGRFHGGLAHVQDDEDLYINKHGQIVFTDRDVLSNNVRNLPK